MNNETWTPINGTDGLYDVSNYGRVRSWNMKSKDGNRRLEPVLLAGSTAGAGGYRLFTLHVEGKIMYRKAHRLVAEHFIGPKPFAKAVARHLDDNPDNNHVSNIKWGTSKDNAKDRVRNGSPLAGEGAPAAKYSDAQLDQVRDLVAYGFKRSEVAEMTGISYSSVSRAVANKRS